VVVESKYLAFYHHVFLLVAAIGSASALLSAT
jgi:hypothetical protein